MPFIPKSQYSIKHTNGGEFYNPRTGVQYKGEYIQYGTRYFAGNSILDLNTPLKRIEIPKGNIVVNKENFLYNQLNIDIHYLILQIKLKKQKVFYVYPIDYISPNQSMFWKFFNNDIDRKNRVKVIPYIKNNTSIFMKNNKPVMIGKKINVEFNQFEKVLQINLVLNNNFLIRKILNYILSKDKSVYVGLTIETYPEDYYGEELLCIFGLNSLLNVRS